MEVSDDVTVMYRRLGKLPPKYDPRTLRLAHYIEKRKVPKVPSFHILSKKTVKHWGHLGMMENDQYGNCTFVALAHAFQTWTVYGGKPWRPSDDAIVREYLEHTDGKDEGAYVIDVLNDVRHNGLAGNKIFAYAAVTPTNIDQVKTAVFLFGGLYVGMMLPANAQGQDVWDLKDGNGSEPGSWGGHAVNVVDYGKQGVTFVTWGRLQKATWAWWNRYVDEAYAVLEEDYVGEDKRSPQGFSLERLRKDLTAL